MHASAQDVSLWRRYIVLSDDVITEAHRGGTARGNKHGSQQQHGCGKWAALFLCGDEQANQGLRVCGCCRVMDRLAVHIHTVADAGQP